MASGPIRVDAMSKKVSAVARVQIVLEITVGTWGDDCTVKQVHEAAAREAPNAVRIALQNAHVAAQLIGEPKVIAVLTERET